MRGEACDANRAIALCPDGTFCVEGACGAADAACPAAWDALDLDEAREPGADAWSLEGDTTDAEPLSRGSCGGGANAVVHTFTAPSAGSYAFRVTSDDEAADTVLYIRSRCDVPDVAAELACNDDETPSVLFTSLATVDLAARQTVYVFVDGYVSADSAWAGPYTLTATALDAPEVDSIEAVYNAEARRLGLRATGTSQAPVLSFRIQFLDAGGDVLPVDDTDEPLEIPFDDVQTDGERYTATFVALVPDEALAFTQVRIAIGSDDGAWTEPQDVPLSEPEVREAGAACDPLESFDVCRAPLRCADVDGGGEPGGLPTTCRELAMECPADWPVVDLAQHAVAGGWEYAGDTSDGEDRGAGTCGGGGPAEVLRFTAPAAGRYAFTITDAGDADPDTVLYARTHCEARAASAELACNDDQEGGVLLSRIAFDLGAGETAWLFVNGYNGEWSGTYTIRGERE